MFILSKILKEEAENLEKSKRNLKTKLTNYDLFKT